MSTKVAIDMYNPNALISMAMVSENSGNPYLTFCEYIKFCIFVNNVDATTVSEIREDVKNEFGIQLPHGIILSCLEQLKKDGFITTNRQHQIFRNGEYDTKAFEEEKIKYQTIEQKLVEQLIVYAEKYNRKVSFEDAREKLINILDRDRLAYDIFAYSRIGEEEDACLSDEGEVSLSEDDQDSGDEEHDPLFSDEYIIGRFLKEILSTDTPNKRYLQNVCTGLMLCAGTYQLPDANAPFVPPPISDTIFFFDTRLLLRFLGCAGEAAIESAHELVNLIQKANGKIYYYPQTHVEIGKALKNAIEDLRHGFPPNDPEMRLFVSRVTHPVQVLKGKEFTFARELSASRIFPIPNEPFSEYDPSFFDVNELERFMKSKLKWEQVVIENDAKSIWETHMRRQGIYSEYFGYENNLPVFVTTNSTLLRISLMFQRENPSIAGVKDWKRGRLPVISDKLLTCRIWSPATDSDRLSLLYLTANVVASQRPSQRYINKVRELAIELGKNVPEYSNIFLPEYFSETVTDAIFENTHGREAELDIGSFASSIQELTELKMKEQEDVTRQVKNERDKISSKLDSQTQAIIESAVKSNRNRLGPYRILLLFCLHWSIIVSILVAGGSGIISFYTGNWGIIAAALIPIALGIFEHATSSEFIGKRMLEYLLPKAEYFFEQRTKRRLGKAEEPYQEVIVGKAMEQTPLLCRCKSITGI